MKVLYTRLLENRNITTRRHELFKFPAIYILTNIPFLIALSTQLLHAIGVISCSPSLDLMIVSLTTLFPLKKLHNVEFWGKVQER